MWILFVIFGLGLVAVLFVGVRGSRDSCGVARFAVSCALVVLLHACHCFVGLVAVACFRGLRPPGAARRSVLHAHSSPPGPPEAEPPWV